MNKIFDLIATYFYIGKSPKAPGTVATMAAIPLWYALSHLTDVGYLTAVFLITFIGILAAQSYESRQQKHDSQVIVIDEVAGYLITMSLAPINWQTALLGFCLFRFFDITKPFPIGYLDRKIPGGVGVMADDIAAGIISSIILQLLIYFLPIYFN